MFPSQEQPTGRQEEWPSPLHLCDEQRSTRNPQGHQRDVVDGGLDKRQACCDCRQDADHHLEPAPELVKANQTC